MKRILAIIPFVENQQLLKKVISETKRSVFINRVIVLTGNVEIVQLSNLCGAEAPFLYDKEEADAVLYTINWFRQMESYVPDYVIVIKYEKEILTSEQIDTAIEKLLSNAKIADSLISLTQSKYSPYFMKKVNQFGQVEDFMGRRYLETDILPGAFIPNDIIQIAKTESFLIHKGFQTDRTIPFIMDLKLDEM